MAHKTFIDVSLGVLLHCIALDLFTLLRALKKSTVFRCRSLCPREVSVAHSSVFDVVLWKRVGAENFQPLVSHRFGRGCVLLFGRLVPCFCLCWQRFLQDPASIAAQTRQEQPRMGSLRLQVVRFLETLVGMDSPSIDQVLMKEVSGRPSRSWLSFELFFVILLLLCTSDGVGYGRF